MRHGKESRSRSGPSPRSFAEPNHRHRPLPVLPSLSWDRSWRRPTEHHHRDEEGTIGWRPGDEHRGTSQHQTMDAMARPALRGMCTASTRWGTGDAPRSSAHEMPGRSGTRSSGTGTTHPCGRSPSENEAANALRGETAPGVPHGHRSLATTSTDRGNGPHRHSCHPLDTNASHITATLRISSRFFRTCEGILLHSNMLPAFDHRHNPCLSLIAKALLVRTTSAAVL